MKFTFAPESKPLDGFTIKRAIHRGGFGEVYYALTDAGKEVALKLLHNNLEVELRGVTQCLNLKHPNLVTIFDIRQDSEKDHWIVMEFVGGKGLYEVLHDHPAGMPIRDVLFWMSGITSGLSFLHDRGIVHRDLKPANIFCDADTVKIGDVGLSKFISESRRSAQTQSVGTVYYMAPEVARGRYGREVDVYSMGVILYEMITGRVPFEGETTAEILMKHLTAEPDLSVLPEKMRPVLQAALEKDPDRRISDVEELERRFRLAVNQSGLSVDKPTPVGESSSTRQKRSAPAMATTLLGNAHSASSQAGTAAGWNQQLQAVINFWNDSVPTPAKWVIGAIVVVVVLNRGILHLGFPEIVALGIVYVVYRKWYGQRSGQSASNTATRESTSQAAGRPSVPAKPPAPPMPAAPPVMATARSQAAPVELPQAVRQKQTSAPRIYTPATLRQIPGGQRVTDMTTSLSVSMAAVVLVTVAVHYATALLPDFVDVIFFGVVTLLAAWTLILPAKFWEGRSGDAIVRRLIQGSLGIGIGAVAYSLQKFLMLDDVQLLQANVEGAINQGRLGRITLVDSQQLPTMAGFMAFFGLLFLIRRWWWQADSFRKSRFRISSSLVTLLLGLILSELLPFPELLGATWAVAISAVVQLSSGWTPQEERLLAPTTEDSLQPPVLAQVVHPVMATPAVNKV